MGKKVIRSIVIAAIVVGTIVLGVGCAIALPPLDPSKLEMPDNVTRIYSADQKEVVEMRTDKGEPIQHYDKIPVYLKQAIIATEDRQFYEHSGINYRSIARAVYRDILAGGKVEGASTITQQLVKNVYLDQNKTFTRKIEEIALAAQIEREYTKEDILEMYMNKVNFHPSSYGIEAAAQTYFNTDVEHLTLGQAAYLAGLPQSPSYYYNNPDEALKRRGTVLQNMVHEEYITQAQADAAAKEPVPKERKEQNKFKYPNYVEYVLDEAERLYGIPKEQIMRGGMDIYTNLDVQAQESAEKQFNISANFPGNGAGVKDGVQSEGAMVMVNPKNGGITAMVGRRDTNSFLDLNRAFQDMASRQPGSAIKPLIAYGPAIDMDPNQYGPNTILTDKLGTSFGTPPYAPKDWDNHTQIKRGEKVTMRTALQWSFNIPAVDLLNQITLPKGKAFAEKAGIPFDPNDNGLGIALGGMEHGVTPLQMADAYQAFANNGVRIQAHAINKISTSSGTIIAQATPKSIQVMKEATAKTITSLLQVVVNEGTGIDARINRPVAGKTGTTEFGNISGANRDAWFVGYTPDTVTAIWMGFDKTDNQHYLGADANHYPAKMFSRIMPDALKGHPVQQFAVPPVPEKKQEDTKTLQLSGEFTGKSVILKWSPISDNAIYAIFRTESVDQAEGGLPIAMTRDAKFVDTDLEPGKTYYYIVSAVDSTDQKQQLGQSNILTVKTANDKNSGKDKPQDPSTPPVPGTGDPNTGGTGTGTGGSSGGTSGTNGGTGGTTGGTGGTTDGTTGQNSGNTTGTDGSTQH